MRALALAALALWLPAAGPGLRAQVSGGEAAELRDAAGRVARAWAAADAAAVEALFAPDGVRFGEGTGGRGVLDRRKAGAAIRDLLERLDGGRVVVERARVAGGTPPRGFAELRWDALPRGTSERISYTLFVGMVEASGGWRVDEIRLLR